jgi:predicted DNA-binding transcriptional regulator AlpA
MAYDTHDPILSEKEYTAWAGISAPTAQRQRSDGSGPPFIQLSERRIGYRKSASNGG